jgi:hypothetical protein
LWLLTQALRNQQALKFCRTIDPQTGLLTGWRNPVETLSKDSHAFMHKPFDVSEVSCWEILSKVLCVCARKCVSMHACE